MLKQQSSRPEHAAGIDPKWTVVLASIGVFMTALDVLVVTTSLPAIRADLHASLSSLEWTINAYNLAFACLILTGAALGDRFGRRRMYAAGIALFTAGSAAAALAPSAGALIAARTVQGAGAAVVLPLTLTLISEAFPVEKRGAAIGLWGGIQGLGIAIGPVVGGAIVSGINWHWIFWLNVPVGLVIVPLALTHLKESFGPKKAIDFTGLLLAGLSALGITWGLIRANTAGWASAQVIVSLVVGILLVVAFVAWERRVATPMIQLDFFTDRTFTAANAVAFFLYGGLLGALFLMSQFFQNCLGYSPLEAGLRLLPWSVPTMFVAPIAGKLADKYGNRPFMILGLVFQGLGLGWVALIASPHVSYPEVAAALVIAGTGTSCCFPTVANAVMGSVPLGQAGAAAGTNTTIQALGGVFGVAILATVFSRHGEYASKPIFVAGFTAALWCAVGLSGIGIIAALQTARRAKGAQVAEERRLSTVRSGALRSRSRRSSRP
jgi:EmrB/QacA subfamily drug resistance transporter